MECTHLADGIKGVTREDMLSVFHRLMETLSKTEIDFVASIWWVTWNARNKFIFEGKKYNPVIAAG